MEKTKVMHSYMSKLKANAQTMSAAKAQEFKMFADLAMFPAHLSALNGAHEFKKIPVEEGKEDLGQSFRFEADDNI